MSNNSVILHRIFTANPEKIYRAFTQPNALISWIPPNGFIASIDEMNVKVGGSFKMSFINFTTEKINSFGGKYLELKKNEFLRYTDKFDNPELKGEIITSVWLKKVSCGTEIKIIQEGIPEVIPIEMCYLGWQESLEKLKKLVETEILDK